MRKILVAAGVLLLTLFAGWRFAREVGGGGEGISAQAAYRMMAEGGRLAILDVRTPEEFASQTGHLAGAQLIPLQDLERKIDNLEELRDSTLLVYCHSGGRSSRAVSMLTERGFRALNLEGGIQAWNREGLPVVRQSGH